ncbi:MAG: peptidylprolyl isomerase [Planctomycetes bacterium]|nr:peptidylprolyl isomerase [Planctomycetota bacterium]
MNGRALAAIDRVVPREKIEREWGLRYGRRGRKYDLRLIQFDVRVETPSDGDLAARTKAEERVRAARLADAERVRELALAGADFGQLAQEHSSDAETRARRGKPASGLFDHQGWPASFLDALDGLRPGDVSKPLYARGGWWLVQVKGVTVTPLADVEKALAADLLARGPEDDEIEAVRQALSDGAEVRVLPGMTAAQRDPELEAPDTTALTIGGVPVSRGEYATWVIDLYGETFARTFAEDLLVHAKAEALGVRVDEDEVQARAREYVQDIVDRDFMENRQRWYDKLAVRGQTEEEFLREQCVRMRTSLLVEKLVLRERVVTDAEIRRRFQASLGPDGAWREVSKLLVSSRYEELDHGQPREDLVRDLATAVEKARLRAVEFVARLRAGADFATLARAESDDPRTRSKGGVLSGAFKSDDYPDDVARAVLALPEGAISDPIPLGPTWLVFWVRSLRKPALEDVRETLRAELQQLRPGLLEVRTYRNVLANQARIEYRPRSTK